jgi:hypothetical protein
MIPAITFPAHGLCFGNKASRKDQERSENDVAPPAETVNAITLIGWGFQPRCDTIPPVTARVPIDVQRGMDLLTKVLASAAAVICSVTALIWASAGDVIAASHWVMGAAGCIYLARAHRQSPSDTDVEGGTS